MAKFLELPLLFAILPHVWHGNVLPSMLVPLGPRLLHVKNTGLLCAELAVFLRQRGADWKSVFIADVFCIVKLRYLGRSFKQIV